MWSDDSRRGSFGRFQTADGKMEIMKMQRQTLKALAACAAMVAAFSVAAFSEEVATHFWWRSNGEESDAIRELNARYILWLLADIRRKWGAELPAILGGDLNSTEHFWAESMNYFASELLLLSRGLIVTITSPRSDA